MRITDHGDLLPIPGSAHISSCWTVRKLILFILSSVLDPRSLWLSSLFKICVADVWETVIKIFYFVKHWFLLRKVKWFIISFITLTSSWGHWNFHAPFFVVWVQLFFSQVILNVLRFDHFPDHDMLSQFIIFRRMLVPFLVRPNFRLNISQYVQDFNIAMIDANALRFSEWSVESSPHGNNLASFFELSLSNWRCCNCWGFSHLIFVQYWVLAFYKNVTGLIGYTLAIVGR